jgi:hypothetical protein
LNRPPEDLYTAALLVAVVFVAAMYLLAPAA